MSSYRISHDSPFSGLLSIFNPKFLWGLGCHALVILMMKLKVANLFVVDLVSICTSSVTCVYLGHIFSFLMLLIWSPYALPVSHLFTYVVYSPFPIWANPTFIPPPPPLSLSLFLLFLNLKGFMGARENQNSDDEHIRSTAESDFYI